MTELFTLLCVNFLALITPGPDFAVVTYHCLSGSRRNALFASLGIAAALLINSFFYIFGVFIVINKFPMLFCFMQLLGAGYLGFLGCQIIYKSKRASSQTSETKPANKAFLSGFLTHILNAQAMVFLFILFSRYLDAKITFCMKLICGFTIPLTAFIWYTLLTFVGTSPKLLDFLSRYQSKIDIIISCMFLFFSISIIYNVLTNNHF